MSNLKQAAVIASESIDPKVMAESRRVLDFRRTGKVMPDETAAPFRRQVIGITA